MSSIILTAIYSISDHSKKKYKYRRRNDKCYVKEEEENINENDIEINRNQSERRKMKTHQREISGVAKENKYQSAKEKKEAKMKVA